MVSKSEKRPQVSKTINAFFAVARGTRFGKDFEGARPILSSLGLPGQAMRSIAKMIYNAQQMNLKESPNVIVAGAVCALCIEHEKGFDYEKVAKAMRANVSNVRNVANIFTQSTRKRAEVQKAPAKQANSSAAKPKKPSIANQDLEKLTSRLRTELTAAIGAEQERMADELKETIESRFKELQVGLSKREDNNGASERLEELDSIVQKADSHVLKMLQNDNWWLHIKAAAEVLRETAFQRDAQRSMLRMIYTYGYEGGLGRGHAEICMACAYMAALDYGHSLNFEKALERARVTEPRIKIVAIQLALHDLTKLPSMRILEGLGIAESGRIKSGYLLHEQSVAAKNTTNAKSRAAA